MNKGSWMRARCKRCDCVPGSLFLPEPVIYHIRFHAGTGISPFLVKKQERPAGEIAKLFGAVNLPADYMERYPSKVLQAARGRGLGLPGALSVSPRSSLSAMRPVSALDVSISGPGAAAAEKLQEGGDLPIYSLPTTCLWWVYKRPHRGHVPGAHGGDGGYAGNCLRPRSIPYTRALL